MMMNWMRRRGSTGKLLAAVTLIGFAWLPSGCGGRVARRPELPMAFHFMEPGSTNVVIVPAECRYGIWTTDKGLLYLQGLAPE